MVFRRRSRGAGELQSDCGEARSVDNAVDLSSTDSDDVEGTAAADVFVPRLRHGAAAACGPRASMEDCHVGHDDFTLPAAVAAAAAAFQLPSTHAFYAVFDGHGGVTAAEFAGRNLLDLTLAEAAFPSRLPEALRASFMALDAKFYQEVAAGRIQPSGSTALAALVWGNQLLVANAGDSRAVLCRNGKAVALSTDHKPAAPAERARIIESGGVVCCEGRLNGELTVARSIGDFHLETLKTAGASGALLGPLTAEPEVVAHALAPEDEFLLLGCDGLWDVLSSQRAVDLARAHLRAHNDPAACSDHLVKHALELHTADNVSVVTVCFQDALPPRRSPPEARRPAMMGRTLSKEGLSLLSSALLPATSTCLPHIPEAQPAALQQLAAQLSGL